MEPPPESLPPLLAQPVARRAVWLLLGLGVAVIAIVAAIGVVLVKQGAESRRDKAVNGNLRQLSAALDQVLFEDPDRIFMAYDEVVGPGRYLQPLNAVVGEDYRPYFPVRRDQTEMFLHVRVLLPNGQWAKVSAPFPPQPDGVEVLRQEDGSRFETTWRGGVPHGAFRAYRANGRLWGEATYTAGYIRGPSWIYRADGTRYDELALGNKPTR